MSHNYQPLTNMDISPSQVRKKASIRSRIWTMSRQTNFWLFLILIIVCTVTILLFSYKTNNYPATYWNEENVCKIPKLDPYHPSILKLIEDPKLEVCYDEFPLLFNSTFESTIVPVVNLDELKKYGITEPCCYQTVQRRQTEPYNDNAYELSSTCLPISLENTTVIPQEYDFISIKCNRRMTFSNGTVVTGQVMDMHAFIHIKPEVEEKVLKIKNHLKKNGSLPEDRVNVVILGIDAVSHMNFKRVMPKSYNFLKNNLSAVEMNGVNKVGSNSLPNVGAAFAGAKYYAENGTLECEDTDLTYDKCPMIWKKYAQNGYRTFYGEDDTGITTYNYVKRGFKFIPTDYYMRPFGMAAHEIIGTHKKLFYLDKECYGPRMQFDVVLNYLQKMAHTMDYHRRYFQLLWTATLTHNFLNVGKFGDQSLLSTLTWLKGKGYLDNTMFILMSDHGILYGDILEYPIGRLESRMPFLFFVAPSWFQQKYSQAFKNLEDNRNKLTTPFDLHETLSDLVNLNSLSDETILAREETLQAAEKDKQLPLGISQFLPLPKSRTCDMAGIPKHFCICGRSEAKLPLDNLEVQQAAGFAVRHINTMVSKQRLCASLTLVKVKSAAVVKLDEGGGNKSTYQISFETKPGGGRFDASVEKNSLGNLTIDAIERSNMYGNQSHCVKEKALKIYCYCVDLL